MTIQEAIEVLSEIRSGYNCFNDSERPFYHALSMAIETLQARASRNYEPILTEAEQSEVVNAIVDALPSYQVDGYADNNGMFFDVFISKVERGEADD